MFLLKKNLGFIDLPFLCSSGPIFQFLLYNCAELFVTALNISIKQTQKMVAVQPLPLVLCERQIMSCNEKNPNCKKGVFIPGYPLTRFTVQPK